MLMALVALALVLSLAATQAPVAGAQDSGATPSDTSNWARYRMPTAQQLEAAAAAVNGFAPKDCCITVQYGCGPQPTNGTNPPVTPAEAAATCMPRPRWFCTGIE